MINRHPFRTRNFITIVVAGCFFVLVATGLVLFVVPPGRVANWTDWTLFFLSKHEWSAIHITVSLLFISAGVFHLVLNWRAFTHYITSKMKGVDRERHLRCEGIWAALILLFVVIGSVISFPPFSWVMDIHENLRSSWTLAKNKPAPFGHAEELSLKDLANKTHFDVKLAIEKLKLKGIMVVSEDQTLREISNLNGLSPARIYSVLNPTSREDLFGKHYRQQSNLMRRGMQGLGQKNVQEVADDLGININQALSRLSSIGIQANKNDSLRKLSTDNYRPFELLTVIQGPQLNSQR